IHVQSFLADHHRLATDRNASLDEVLARVFRIAEDDDVALSRLPERGEPVVEKSMAADAEVDLRAVEHLVDEEIVADEKGVLHRAGRNLVSLRDDAAEGYDEEDAEDDCLDPLLER